MPALTRDNVTTVARWRAGATPGRVFAAGAATYLLLCVASYRFVRPDTLFYFTDYWEHRAVVAEVIRHGTSLLDPVYGEAAPSRQFTPWSLALGYLSRLSGWSVDTSLAAGALVVSGLFVSGVHAFARAYYRHRWAPAVLLAALTCAWGIPPLIWTGFHSLRSQLHGNYYPASLVFALTLIAWALTVRLLQTEMRTARSLARATLLVLLVAIALVTHPLNAALLLAGAGALAMVYPDVPPARRLGVLALLGGGVLASAGWPYFNPLAMAGSGAARGQATFNNFGFFFDPMFVVALLWPAGFALAAIRAQLLEPRTRVPAIACIAIFAAYVAGGIADVSVSHRLLAYVALALQLMLVWLVLDVIDGHPPGALEQVSAKGWRVAGRIAAVIVAMQVLLAIQQLVQP